MKPMREGTKGRHQQKSKPVDEYKLLMSPFLFTDVIGDAELSALSEVEPLFARGNPFVGNLKGVQVSWLPRSP